MKPLHLYIENFMCYESGYIDFTKFNSALVVGKVENNELVANGVGKSTIFRAIEYVLFNQSNFNLEKIIRDDMSFCRVVLDFYIGDQEYRLSRKRTNKGSTDVSLYTRTAQEGSDEEVYHTISSEDHYIPVFDEKEKYWKNISGSRSRDTEADLDQLIKINFKSFRSTVHFMQHDYSGLATVTPEKRKGILKDALNLIIYSKLEKIAKEKQATLAKEIDKNTTLLESFGDLDQELLNLKEQLQNNNLSLLDKESTLITVNSELAENNNKINDLNNFILNLEEKFSSSLSKEQSLLSEKSKIETSIKEYTSKKSNVVKFAKDLVSEIDLLKKEQLSLAGIDYSQIDILNEQISSTKEQIISFNISIKNNLEKYEELKVPVPDDSICKHCRQPTTDDHRKSCLKQISQEMKYCQNNIKKLKGEISDNNIVVDKWQQTINSLSLSKKKLENINTNIVSKSKELQDKKSLHDEYAGLLDKFIKELDSKKLELEEVQEELKNSSIQESKNTKEQISLIKKNIDILNVKVAQFSKEIAHLSNARAVFNHTIEQKNKDIKKQKDLKKSLVDLESKISMYPSVIQSFSTTGIPNLIIQNVLDDLQSEANNLLLQLKPGLQLSFSIAKTRDDGVEADTLDIQYYTNGRERYYEQLSGAMQLAVTFSLKLGLSFLLQKMIGTDIRFLLLDEIDQSLDKASVDAFADIVKFFQKDYTIMVITHNDRLKDKFSHAILVEQDVNSVSHAKVVSTW